MRRHRTAGIPGWAIGAWYTGLCCRYLAACGRRVTTMFAYTWPLLNLFWTFLMFAGIALLLFFVIFCFVDNFRRRDHSGWAKAGWTVVIFLIPFLGSVIYIVARPADAQLAT
jgi:hypothetical protein